MSSLQKRQLRQTLFAQRRQIARNASKVPQILQEGEDGFLLFAQAIELAPRLLLALLAQASRLSSKAIQRWGQVAIVAIFREPVLQGFHWLTQAAYLLTLLLDQGVLLTEQRLLLDEFVSLRQLLSQIEQFFFNRHALTLLGLTPFGKSPADLGSYQLFSFRNVIYTGLLAGILMKLPALYKNELERETLHEATPSVSSLAISG